MSISELNLNIYENNSKRNLSLYVHIPFCNSKCNYCAFVSMVANEDDKKRYFINLLNEIKLQAKKYSHYYSVSSIYIGGGTPSCLDYFCIKDLLSCIYKNFAVKNSAEITIEINPNSIDKNKIREYVLAGINRFSIGLQSISPRVLKKMGRTHSVEDFSKTLALIKGDGIKNISVDLIIGYPGQKFSDIKEAVTFLVKHNIPHISAYMLSVEDNTKLKTLVDDGNTGLPGESLVIKMYNYIYNTLKAYGYNRYEFSNFAKPTFESFHNKTYWTRRDYLGVGLAAHSYIDGTRFSNTENIAKYVSKLETSLDIPTEHSKNLTIEEKKEEAVMLSLRTADGLDLNAYKEEFGENFLAKNKAKLTTLIKRKFLILTKDNKLCCTDKGFLVLDKIILELLV